MERGTDRVWVDAPSEERVGVDCKVARRLSQRGSCTTDGKHIRLPWISTKPRKTRLSFWVAYCIAGGIQSNLDRAKIHELTRITDRTEAVLRSSSN